jgi:hypothetical protein
MGPEMRRRPAEFTVPTNIPVYFCDPASPCQRRSNENTNGLVRHYFPKGTDLSVYSAEQRSYGCDGISTRQHNEPSGGQDVWRYHLRSRLRNSNTLLLCP